MCESTGVKLVRLMVRQGLESDGGPFFSKVSRNLWCILSRVDLTLT